MTRLPSTKTRLPETEMFNRLYPPTDECMTLDEMLQGYTSINAVILDLPAKGSIAVGKDADYLVFDNDLTAAEAEGFSYGCWTEQLYYMAVQLSYELHWNMIFLRRRVSVIKIFP